MPELQHPVSTQPREPGAAVRTRRGTRSRARVLRRGMPRQRGRRLRGGGRVWRAVVLLLLLAMTLATALQ